MSLTQLIEQAKSTEDEAGYEDELCGGCEWLNAYAELDRRAAR